MGIAKSSDEETQLSPELQTDYKEYLSHFADHLLVILSSSLRHLFFVISIKKYVNINELYSKRDKMQDKNELPLNFEFDYKNE